MSRPDRERAWACDRTALTKRQLADTYQRGNVGAAATVAAARGDDLGLHHPRYHCHSIQAWLAIAALRSLCVGNYRNKRRAQKRAHHRNHRMTRSRSHPAATIPYSFSGVRSISSNEAIRWF